jgi:hypothetical protein
MVLAGREVLGRVFLTACVQDLLLMDTGEECAKTVQTDGQRRVKHIHGFWIIITIPVIISDAVVLV